ncbi:MAG: CAP domain-containing protein [Planctomycetes bacterium]|nr:CAP domain-containing protein [Planctomycetota bacterium]
MGGLHALPPQADDDEAKFQTKQADLLSDFAEKAFKKGFPRQAKLIWMQAIKLYDADHESSHEGLGHVRMGTTWAPKGGFDYPRTDTGTSADGSALFKAYEALKKKLAANHKRVAKEWEKAERTDKKLFHYGMVLRWVKDDKEAQDALNHHEIGTVTGTDLEQTLYDNSKKIEQAVTDQERIDYEVQPEESKQPLLDAAKVDYVSFKSEHFVLRGDPEEAEALKEGIVWAERALRVCQAAFPADTFPRDLSQWHMEAAYFVAKDTYKQILRANAKQVRDLEWKLEHTSTSGLQDPSGKMIKIGATGSRKVLLDAMVRDVAQMYAGFRTDGLREGIGHTFVGMIFNNNRLFAVDLMKQQGTVASEEDREYQSPDFDVWKDLNLELAWRNTGGVPAAQIPFADAAKFTNEERIKAWSFTDYVMRRDPSLLTKMDRLALTMKVGDKPVSPVAYGEKWGETESVSIAQLDKEWEDFWTGASPVMKAIRNDTPPLAAISRGVERWLKAFNEARNAEHATPVTWSANLSKRCKEHADYLAANKDQRGPALEHRQEPTLGGTHLGSMFAEMAIVETKAKLGSAKKLFKSWLDLPGYRDAIINNYIQSIGLYTEGDILVMNVVSALASPSSKSAQGYKCYPGEGDSGIPSTVAVEDLGPELKTLLEKNGHGDLKEVGFPLTMHFGIGVQGNRQSYKCVVVTDRDERIEGLIMLDNGKIRQTTAPGVVSFYPLKPLKGTIRATWSWEVDGEQRRLTAKFRIK